MYFINEDGTVYTGDMRVGDREATQEEIAAHLYAIENKVPQEITMRQCRLHLHALGKLHLVPEAIAALPEPPRIAAEIEWEYSSVVQRYKPFVLLLSPALGWSTPEEIDAQFVAASKL